MYSYSVVAGVIVNHAVAVIDHELGGTANIAKYDVKVHSLFNITNFVGYLIEANKIDASLKNSVMKFISENRVLSTLPKVIPKDRTKMTYLSRVKYSKCPMTARLLNIMSSKQTNLCFACDHPDMTYILSFAEEVGPYICIFKMHADITSNFSTYYAKILMATAEKHNFLIMDDRKFADSGKTVSLQADHNRFDMFEWAHLTTAHSISGPSVIQGLADSSNVKQRDRGIFLVAQMNSPDALTSPTYTDDTMRILSNSNESAYIGGIICQDRHIVQNPGLLQMTSGCDSDTTPDAFGQRYSTPIEVISRKGADIAVVGRGISAKNNPAEIAKKYRELLWRAYCNRASDPNREIRYAADESDSQDDIYLILFGEP